MLLIRPCHDGDSIPGSFIYQATFSDFGNLYFHWAIPENIHTPPMDDIGNPVRNAQ